MSFPARKEWGQGGEQLPPPLAPVLPRTEARSLPGLSPRSPEPALTSPDFHLVAPSCPCPGHQLPAQPRKALAGGELDPRVRGREGPAGQQDSRAACWPSNGATGGGGLAPWTWGQNREEARRGQLPTANAAWPPPTMGRAKMAQNQAPALAGGNGTHSGLDSSPQKEMSTPSTRACEPGLTWEQSLQR